MENKQLTLLAKPARVRPQRTTLSGVLTLSLWRLRQTWVLWLLTAVSLLAALAIATIAPLLSSVAQNAGLQALLNSSPTRKIMSMTTDVDRLSTSDAFIHHQLLDRLLHPQLNSYLDPSAPQIIAGEKLAVNQPAAFTIINPLKFYATSLARLKPALRLTAGRWASESDQDGILEIMLPALAAQQMKMPLGTELTLDGGLITEHSPANGIDPRNYLHVRLVGIFADPDSTNPALFGQQFQPTIDYTGATYTFLVSDTALLQTLDRLAANEQSSSITHNNPVVRFHLTWYYHLHTDQFSFDQIDDFFSRLSAVQAKLAIADNDAQFFNPAPLNGDTPSLIHQYMLRANTVTLPVTLLACLIIALLLFFACLLTNMLIDRQMNMSALLGSRGASSRQLFWSLVTQAAVLCLLALVLGPLLGALAVFVLASQFVAGPARQALSLTFTSLSQPLALVAPYAGGTFVLALLAICLPFRRASHVNMLEVRRESARASGQPFWLRYYLDVVLAVVALTGFAATLYLARTAQGLDLGTQEFVLAPLIFVAPLLLLLGALLLMLRLFPWLMRLLARRTYPAHGATAMLALVQIARAPRHSMRLIMLLSLAVALSIFSLSFSASQNQHLQDVAAYESGADFAGNLPNHFGLMSPDDVYEQYRNLPGVQAVSTGYVDQGTANGLSDVSFPLAIRAVDSQSFASAAIWGPQDSSQSLSSLLKLLPDASIKPGNITVPAIVDETTIQGLHIAPTGGFDLHLSNQVGGFAVGVHVVAVVDHIPTINGSPDTSDPASTGGVIMDYETLRQAYRAYQIEYFEIPAEQVNPLPLNYLWLRSNDSSSDLTALRHSLNSPELVLANLNDRRQIITELQQDPLSSNILLILSLGAFVALSLALLGNVIASWLNVRLRLGSFVVLRALGATRWHITSLLLWEQGIVYLLSFLLSLIFGITLTQLVVPSLLFTGLPTHGTLSTFTSTQFYLLQHILPGQVVIPGSLGIATGLLVVLCLLSLLFLLRTVQRPAFNEELRLNDD